MFDVDRLVEECRAGLRESSPEVAIREVVGRAMARPDDVERALGTPRMGQIRTLHHSPELTILNVIWAPGMVALGLKWMWNPESPFYIKPRLNSDLLDWGWKFWRASTAQPRS